MNIRLQRKPLVRSIAGAALLVSCVLSSGCAPVRGFPEDPEDTDATLTSLKPYFNGVAEQRYVNAPSVAERRNIRDEIVYARIRAYDIAFAEFEWKLYGDANAVTLGSDLVGLVLAGLTATTGNAATKSALGAASAGVLGAHTAIIKDLYYQKTVPALLAQMEANRLKAKFAIVEGLKKTDAEYSLMQAYIDLDTYKNSGGIPGAINAINREAADAKDQAEANLRNAPFVEDMSSQQLVNYIWPAGIDKPADKIRLGNLRRWRDMNGLANVPIASLINTAAFADQRKQAVKDLSIP
jgi:hypothetical protein